VFVAVFSGVFEYIKQSRVDGRLPRDKTEHVISTFAVLDLFDDFFKQRGTRMLAGMTFDTEYAVVVAGRPTPYGEDTVLSVICASPGP